jgi:hypothetical protein
VLKGQSSRILACVQTRTAKMAATAMPRSLASECAVAPPGRAFPRSPRAVPVSRCRRSTGPGIVGPPPVGLFPINLSLLEREVLCRHE